jgi:serine/threonine protein kinase
MGEVYRARDTALGRDVALKVLPEAYAQQADRMGRFEREAKALAALNHPNIAQIYGFEQGPPEGGHYEDSLTITSPGQATTPGLVLGTAAYMSPEQARGQAVDKRADIWACGCVLFEMLTGVAPFGRDTVTETAAAILEREPAWNTLPAATPAAVRRLLRRCLGKDPRRRLHDIADARIELEDVQSGAGTEGPAPACRKDDVGARASRRGLRAGRAGGPRMEWLDWTFGPDTVGIHPHEHRRGRDGRGVAWSWHRDHP